MVTFPLGKNKFMARLENIADEYTTSKFTGQDNSTTKAVRLECIGSAFWDSANALHPVTIKNMMISEKSLTGNMDLTEFKARKIHWKVAAGYGNTHP